MASNYYGAEQTKMADYGYGDDDPYSFGGFSATQQPSSGTGAGMQHNETQRSPTRGTCNNNNNNNNNQDDIYSAVIIAEPLREFTRFTR